MFREWKSHPAKVKAATNTCKTRAGTRSGWMQVLWERGGRAQPHSQPQKCPNFHTRAGRSVNSRPLPLPAQAALHRRRRETQSSTSAGLLLSAQKALSERNQLVNRAKDGSNQQGNIQGMKICTSSPLRSVCSQNLDEPQEVSELNTQTIPWCLIAAPGGAARAFRCPLYSEFFCKAALSTRDRMTADTNSNQRILLPASKAALSVAQSATSPSIQTPKSGLTSSSHQSICIFKR